MKSDSKSKKPEKKTDGSSQGEDGYLPENSFYETPEKTRQVKDKTGWTIREENKMIMGSSKKSKKD